LPASLRASVTLVECPACHNAKGVLAYKKVSKQCFSGPYCQDVWDISSKPPEAKTA
jgi:hypothetical protein